MDTFVRVSLGFAEFVTKLVEETLDSVINSQTEQLKKNKELLEILDLPEDIQENILAPEIDVENEYNSIYTDINKISLLKGLIELTIIESTNEAYLNDLIKRVEFNTLSNDDNTYIKKLIRKRMSFDKRKILTKLAKDYPKVIIESGVITAKFAMNFATTNSDNVLNTFSPSTTQKRLSSKDINNVSIDKEIKNNYIVYEDKETKDKVIVLDKEAIKKNNVSIPDLRLYVKQASNSDNANLLSEVTIKFRTIQ